ncbi:MAG TPA: calcium-binding protein [Solirubrobacterales bacterium]|jgi:Ca2+-binding RTX toxin-like protein|nr:calcium-binding protein [Solirubrobacterales bacterium]
MRFPLGIRMLPVLVAALALLASPTAASPAGTITIHGARSGSRLTLSSNGRRIVVRGRMAHAHPRGCRLRHHRLLAICRLRGAAAIEVQMGPHGDFVEVAKRLPIPLTIYLGAGSDKFIGNGERDTCYSQGSRRNRCVGGPGDDACITGQRNSDCVGGPGNDYCRTGAGSDGCWGGPGRDVCIMGSGEDGCHGEGGNDRLFGGPDPDQLYGGRGWDFCDGLPGLGRSHACAAGPRH